jgi:hypothetical protein
LDDVEDRYHERDGSRSSALTGALELVEDLDRLGP